MNTFLISGLRDRYARTVGELRSLEARRKALKADLVHLKATMRLCQADTDGIEPIAPQITRKWFSDGQCTRMAIDILREAGKPLLIREIASQIMERRRIPETDWRTFKGVCMSVRNGLRHHDGREVIGDSEHPRAWAIAP